MQIMLMYLRLEEGAATLDARLACGAAILRSHARKSLRAGASMGSRARAHRCRARSPTPRRSTTATTSSANWAQTMALPPTRSARARAQGGWRSETVCRAASHSRWRVSSRLRKHEVPRTKCHARVYRYVLDQRSAAPQGRVRTKACQMPFAQSHMATSAK